MKKSNILGPVAAVLIAGSAQAEAPKTPTEPLQGLTAEQAAAIINLSPDGASVPLGNSASVGVTRSGTFGTAFTGNGVVGDSDTSAGLKGDINGNATHITATGAKKLNLGIPAVVSVSASGAREDAGKALNNPDYNTNLRGQQVTLGLDAKGIGPIKTMGIAATKGKTNDATLAQKTELSALDRIVDTGVTTDEYIDEYSRTVTTRYLGSEFTRALARATMDVGSQGEVMVSGGREHNNLLGDKNVWDVRGTAYLGTAGKVSAHVGEPTAGQKQAGVEYTYPLSRELSLQGAYSQTRGLVDEKRAALNLVWTPGAKGRYDRPSQNQALSAKNIARENLSNPAYELRNLGSYGKVETTVTAPELQRSTLQSSTLNKPSLNATPLALSVVGADVMATFASSTPGVSYECRIDGGAVQQDCTSPKKFPGLANGNHTIEVRPVNTTRNPKTGMDETVLGDWVSSSATVAVNAMLQIGTVKCTTTSITVGNTTTCSIAPTDPQGISGVTATIDGRPATVIGVGTYSVVLSGLTVGNHSLVWSAVGKMPDGSAEATPATASQTIVVNAAPVLNHAPAPTYNGFTTDASLTMNYSGTLTANDGDGDTLTYAIQSAPSTGTLTLTNPTTGAFTYTGSVMPGTYNFTYTVTDNKSAPVAKTATITINDVPPVAGGAFAALADMTISDAAGLSPIIPINAGGVTDPLGRTITYSATGLPPGLTIDPSTGVISGTYDNQTFANQNFSVTITASNGTSQIQKNFVLTVRDDG